ncbi:MAG: flagellar biosynthesis protein FlgL, partial [Sulfurimonas sp.]|nr:flagellar biosynthesis protein FlgL [Sulfurimonas sp.]
NQAFNIDPATTYDDLKNQIELAGDFTVDIVGDTITLNATAQGVAKGVSVSAPLTTTNGAVTVTTTTTDSVIAANIDATIYDRTEFAVDGARLSSSTPQIIWGTNAFATESTKLIEVADLSQGTVDTLDGTSFTLEGININGNPYLVQIDLATAGSTFTLDGGLTNYDIFDVGSPRAAVDADEMTYKQLMDVVNMTVTGTFLPAAPGSEFDYDDAIIAADLKGSTSLGYDGRIQFKEANAGNTEARIALYDSNSGDFSAPASTMTFNTNNAITIRDPKTDFFKTINDVIVAVENYKLYPDSSSGDTRNVGIENAISVIDDLQDHIFRAHAQVGSQSNALSRSIERTGLLEISSMTLRSSVIDTDLAEASLTLTQLSLNYEAMLSTVGKISKLSLVNYL